MKSSEDWKQDFASEGFPSVYEWTDPAGTVYPEHAHKGKVAIAMLSGSITFDFKGEEKKLTTGDRFDVPVGALHTAVVGENGWSVVVGEEIEGDS